MDIQVAQNLADNALSATLIDGMDMGVIIIDQKFCIARWNQWMALQTRRLSGKVIGIPLPELYPYLTTQKLTDQMQEVLNGGNAL